MSNKRLQVLVAVDWYLPGFRAGGPIRSVAGMAAALKEHVGLWVVTRDRDLGAREPYPNVPVNEWTERDGVRVLYLAPEKITIGTWRKLLKERTYDAVFLNSFFSLYFTLVPLWLAKKQHARPRIVLAPRGMLGKGALKLKSAKKRIFIALAKGIGLFSGIVWQASTKHEEADIRAFFGDKATVHQVPNFSLNAPDIRVERKTGAKSPGEARFVYVSRIAEVKNLDAGIRYFGHLSLNGADVRLDIVGTIDDEAYWAKCEEAIQEVDNGVRIEYQGMLPHEKVQEIMGKSHFMVLPSTNENFGHVVLEALAVGCPVIISDRTPWQDLKEAGVGWVLPLEERAFVEALEQCIRMDNETYERMAENAVAYAGRYVADEQKLEKQLAVFRSDRSEKSS